MKIIHTSIALLLLLPIVASSNDTSECYKQNINLGNENFYNKKYNESIKYYKKSYNCSLTKKEKIISLASLATSERKINNKETSKIYLEKLLSISPQNKWAKKFSEENSINIIINERSSPIQEKKVSYTTSDVGHNENIDNNLLNGNDVILKYDDNSITTFERKNIENKFINKYLSFNGAISDVTSRNEIKLQISSGNYANVTFDKNLPTEYLKKGKYITIKGRLSEFGTGILVKHDIENASLLK
jgi:tetratricopeptide (TPR) repeat protein